MKKILVLTDFSENAAHAAKTAVTLSSRLNANLLLLNCFTSQPLVADYVDGGAWMLAEPITMRDQSRDDLRDMEKDLEPMVAALPRERHHPSIQFQASEGKLGDNVRDIEREKDIELVVMGSRSENTLEHLVIGSDTSAVIKKSVRPILVVPEKIELKRVKKVTLASDYSARDIEAIHYLIKLGHSFDFHLHIVHIDRYNHPKSPEKKEAFIKRIHRLKYPKISYGEIKGKDVINRLSRHCAENGDDILALVHYPASFLSQLIEASTTKTALAHQTIPLLIIPSTIQEKN